jgi:hydrogenase nickel incorporation protein HypB
MSENRIEVVESIMIANDAVADDNRRAIEAAGVFSLNVMASPGAGKTTLIEATIAALRDRYRIAVIDGDIATSIDADRAARAGAAAVQINTGGACHLDAPMVSRGLARLDLKGVDLLIVENVGNLVCPAEFRIGTHGTVLVASVPEGDDKPEKYPIAYRAVEALVLNKIDLLPYVSFDVERFESAVRVLNPDVEMFRVSCTAGSGLTDWTDWVRRSIEEQKRAR